MATVRRIALGYNNVYLVQDDGEAVFVDTGPDYLGAWDALTGASEGVRASLVVATHGHSDHAGLGARWQAGGVPVGLGVEDLHFTTTAPLAAHDELARMAEFVRGCGAPPDAEAEALAGLHRRHAQGQTLDRDYPPAGSRSHWPTGLRYQPFTPARLLRDGDSVGAGLRVVACPGHTPGNLVLVHQAEGWLFSGDQLLAEITSTPAIQVDPRATNGWRFHSLPAFVRSMERVATGNYSRCFPGHGEPFDNVGEIIAVNLDQVAQRSERVLAALRADGPATLYGLCERLYPRALRRRFWQIIPTVLGHLDLLEESGAVLGSAGQYRVSG